MSYKVKSFQSLIAVTVAALCATGASAQLIPNLPVRIQVGNAPSLLGTPGPSAPIGISVLSSSYGSASQGVSVRVLGTDKVAGVTVFPVNPANSSTKVIVTNGLVQNVTTAILKK